MNAFAAAIETLFADPNIGVMTTGVGCGMPSTSTDSPGGFVVKVRSTFCG